MQTDKHTRTILLPDNESDFKIIRIPDFLRNKIPGLYLIGNSQLYELKEIRGGNNQIRTIKDEAVKSIILESETEEGHVIQTANVVVATKFNLVYLLISIMWNNEKFRKRFITYEDFIDSLVALLEMNEWVEEIPENLLRQSLLKICDRIEENDEDFYKYSQKRVFDFIEEKVQKLATCIKSNPKFVFLSKISQELIPPIELPETEMVPLQVMDSSIVHQSINFICGSYLPEELKSQFIEGRKYNFEALDQHLKKVRAQKDAYKVSQGYQDSIVADAKASRGSKANKNKNDKRRTQNKKKPVEKVAVGKGALDGFFKKV